MSVSCYPGRLHELKEIAFTALWMSVLLQGLSSHCSAQASPEPEVHPAVVQQVVVYREPGRFAGWPANHGFWCWGEELLVGFSRGYHFDHGSAAHNIDHDRPEDFLLARSLDGGSTWTTEFPNQHGDLIPRGKSLHGTELPGVAVPPLRSCTRPVELTHLDFAMALRTDDNDGGQSEFSYSYNRGHSWNGPFALPNIEGLKIAARTDMIVDGANSATVMLTAAKANGREGRVLCARTTDGGQTFRFLSWVNDEIAGYEIMPSTVRISPTHLLTITRVREPNMGKSYLDAYQSLDNGTSWSYLNRPVEDTGEGTPPSALRLADGRICLTYAYRAKPYQILARLSGDDGQTWGEPILLRTRGGGRDMGYPRSIQTASGQVVTAYYFWDTPSAPERYIAATIWDPKKVGPIP